MSILSYEILNPIVDKKRPFLDKNGLFYFYIEYPNIKYYLECARINDKNNIKEYFILLSEYKFDSNCRICKIDSYGRCKFKPKGELKTYIQQEVLDRGNIDVIKIDDNGVFVTYLIK